MEEGSEIGEGEGCGVRAVEGVGIEVENGGAGGGSGGGEDGFGDSGADDDEVVGGGIERRI